MEKTKAKWISWGVDERTISSWLEFKDEQYLKDITLDTEKKATYNPGGLLRKRIRDGDTVKKVEPQKPPQSTVSQSKKIYTRDENKRWYESLSSEQQDEAFLHASQKFPWLPVHMTLQRQSKIDDMWVEHWTFGMFMQVLGRDERASKLEGIE